MAHILVVDDDYDIRQALQETLEDEGHTVFVAATAPAALEILLAGPPLVVLLDFLMPTMSGLELLRHIHRDAALATRHAYALMTAQTGPKAPNVHDFAPLIQVDFLAKPFDIDELFALVARASARLDGHRQ